MACAGCQRRKEKLKAVGRKTADAMKRILARVDARKDKQRRE